MHPELRSRIKILFVSTGLGLGGAERMLLKLCETIDRSSFEIVVASLADTGEVGRRIQSAGVRVVPIGIKGSRGLVPGLLNLYKLVVEYRPDIVQTWMYHADLIGGMITRLTGQKNLVWGIRNSLISVDMVGKTTALMIRLCALLSAYLPRAILTCSEQAARIHRLAGYQGSKLTVIPNGFDLNSFIPDAEARSSVRREFSVPEGSLIVGMVARFDPQKNHIGFIDAAAQVARHCPDCVFLLVGREVDASNGELLRAVEEAELTDRVKLLGERRDIPRLMAAFDLLASPSHGEAFPNVLGEAMACCVPCVVTDAGDSGDIVGDTGRIVPVGDMDQLAERMLELLLMPETERQALGRRARDRVCLCYDMTNIARRYELFYQNLIASPSTCAG